MSRHAYKMQAIRNIINMMKGGRNKRLAKGRSIWGGLEGVLETTTPAFSAAGGRGLCGLARDLRWRCEEVVKRKGERLPK